MSEVRKQTGTVKIAELPGRGRPRPVQVGTTPISGGIKFPTSAPRPVGVPTSIPVPTTLSSTPQAPAIGILAQPTSSANLTAPNVPLQPIYNTTPIQPIFKSGVQPSVKPSKPSIKPPSFTEESAPMTALMTTFSTVSSLSGPLVSGPASTSTSTRPISFPAPGKSSVIIPVQSKGPIVPVLAQVSVPAATTEVQVPATPRTVLKFNPVSTPGTTTEYQSTFHPNLFRAPSMSLITKFSTAEEVLTSLRDKNNNPIFTQNQISFLKALKLIDGTQVFAQGPPLYLLSAMAIQRGAEKMLSWLQKQDVVKKRLDDVLWDMPDFDRAREKLEIDLGIFKNKSTVSVGVFKCLRCGSRRTVVAETQTRRSDEPATIIVTCDQCKKRWRAQ